MLCLVWGGMGGKEGIPNTYIKVVFDKLKLLFISVLGIPSLGIYGDRFQGSLMPPLVRSPAMISTDWEKRTRKREKKI